MKSTIIILLSFLSLYGSSLYAALDLNDIVQGKFKDKHPAELVFMSDGESYLQLTDDRTQIVKYATRSNQSEILFDVQSARECKLKQIGGFILSPIDQKILVYDSAQYVWRRSFKANYYLYDIKRNLLEPLSAYPGLIQSPSFSPDGTIISFVREGNIYLKKLIFGTEIAITKDARKGQLTNGQTDWLYEEELGISSLMAWSANSQLLAYVKFNTSEVGRYHFNRFDGSTYATLDSVIYPKAGTANTRASLHIYSVDTKDTKPVALPIEADGYIARLVFAGSEQANRLMVFGLNRNQNRMDIYAIHPLAATSKTLYKEDSDSFIPLSNIYNARFYNDNFALLCSQDGYNHLYWYTLGGVLVKRITQGSFEVTDLLGYSAEQGLFYFQSNEANSTQRELYSVGLKGDKPKRISRKAGWNIGAFSPDMRYFMLSHSSTTHPTVASLFDAKGKLIRVLEDNKTIVEALKDTKYPAKEAKIITTPEGVKLNSWIIKPTNFNDKNRYPTIFYSYNGPESQSVKDQWSLGFDQYLAEQGFVVVLVDTRGTAGKGRSFGSASYKRLGQVEAADLIAAAKFMQKQNYVDPNRIGLWGWSYGAYTTIMTLSTQKGDTFKAGVAVAPVTDWKWYDTAYTERYMLRPQENPTGYQSASLLPLASQLKGKLLLVHPTSDDNVHVQHSMEYAKALIESGKDFDMFLYPNQNHSITDPAYRLHLYQKITRFFKQSL